jgi:hypothetical protein
VPAHAAVFDRVERRFATILRDIVAIDEARLTGRDQTITIRAHRDRVFEFALRAPIDFIDAPVAVIVLTVAGFRTTLLTHRAFAEQDTIGTIEQAAVCGA